MGGLQSEQRARGATAHYAALGIICILGFLLRLWHIDREALWGDEALTLIIAHWPIKTLLLDPVDPTPGLYYILHKILIGDAASAIAVRSISLVAGTLTIPATYALARACRAPALSAALLVAISFPLIDYSQEARAYAVLILLVTSSAAAFVIWTRGRGLLPLLIYATTALLAFYTHFVAVFWIVPSVIAARILAQRTPARSTMVVTIIVMELAAFPEIVRLLRYPTGGFSWLIAAGPKRALDTLGYAFLPLGLNEDAATLDSKTVLFAVLSLFAVLVWRGIAHRAKLQSWARENRGAAIALAILVTVPATIWLFSLAKPIFMARTILLAIPAWFVALSLLLRFERRAVRVAVAGLFALALMVTGTNRSKDDWRGLAAQIAHNARPGDVVLVCAHWQAPALRHAFAGHVAAPLLTILNGRWIELEPALGSAANWPTRFFRALETGEGTPVPVARIRSARRIWSISNSCQEPRWSERIRP